MRQASSAASTTRPPRQVELAGKLHDQDRVLTGQSDEHEEADLGEDVVVALGEPHAADGAQERHRHDEDDRERQRPALVLRREHEEDEQHAEREDEHGRVAGQASAGRSGRSTRSPSRSADVAAMRSLIAACAWPE